MRGLPSGTVTLVFSDIEGSTSLLSRLGTDYGAALSLQRSILRTAWVAWNGVEMGTEGDSFYVAFESAHDAVSAMIQGQRVLSSAEWPQGENVRVRMGAHTGDPLIYEDAYVGMDVHRAARIAGVAYGGQVLISAATAELLDGRLPEGVALKDLGGHRLKDIDRPERILQVAIDGMQLEFPQLKTLNASTSLPTPRTRLVGRQGETAEMTALLLEPSTRLLTLTGPGGTGKTRLSIECARSASHGFVDGVYFVPLATLTDAELMWLNIGSVLGVPIERRTPAGIMNDLGSRGVLLILDNLEQIDSAHAVVSELLAGTSRLVILATSRRVLHVEGEYEHRVPPLELPTSRGFDDASTSGAVQLFVQHAVMVKPRFRLTPDNVDHVVEVCRRLDGLPLAIELAATRSGLLSPSALVKRLDSALEFSRVGSARPTRQQTLRSTIAWSFDLLDDDQKHLLCMLGTLSGGGDLEAVNAIAYGDPEADALEGLTALFDASLIKVGEDADGEPRFGLLETIRAFARDELQSVGRLEDAFRAHADHYLGVSGRLQARAVEADGSQFPEVLRQFRVELENFRAVFRWTLEAAQSGDKELIELAIQLGSDLGSLWAMEGSVGEPIKWLSATVEQSGDRKTSALADCLQVLAFLLPTEDQSYDRAYDAAARCVEIWRELDDPMELSAALSSLALVEQFVTGPASARVTFEEAEAVARTATGEGALPALWSVLFDRSVFERRDRQYDRAAEFANATLTIAGEVGDPYWSFMCTHILSSLDMWKGDTRAARQRMADQLAFALASASPMHLLDFAKDYGAALASAGEFTRAALVLGSVEATRERTGARHTPGEPTLFSEPYVDVAAALKSDDWDHLFDIGRNMTVHEALQASHRPSL